MVPPPPPPPLFPIYIQPLPTPYCILLSPVAVRFMRIVMRIKAEIRQLQVSSAWTCKAQHQKSQLQDLSFESLRQPSFFVFFFVFFVVFSSLFLPWFISNNTFIVICHHRCFYIHLDDNLLPALCKENAEFLGIVAGFSIVFLIAFLTLSSSNSSTLLCKESAESRFH